MPGARDGVGGQVVVVQVDEAVAGFGIVIEHLPGSWSERVELFAVAIDGRFRGRGLGRTLVRTLAAWAESRTIYARCAPASDAMRRVLESCGFVPTNRVQGGTTTFELYRAAA